jgi:lysophospholipase L1-like esterase
MMHKHLLHAFGFAMTAALVAVAPAAEIKTYLALGDSVTYGFTTPAETPVSYGDQGYVSLYADWLAARNGGVRPNVVNLAFPGETSSGFLGGGMPGTAYNLNYSASGSQFRLLQSRIASEQAAGHVIEKISLTLGYNDLAELISNPAFQQADIFTQQQLFLDTLGAIRANYMTIMTELSTTVPNAEVMLLGYYNPMAALPSHPFYSLSFLVTGALNDRIAGIAESSGARYVDISAAFSGHEGEWTYILAPPVGTNIHPNAAGYAQIAAQLFPEPSSAALLLAAAPVLLGWRRRRLRLL